jgi:hypothetical protein
MDNKEDKKSKYVKPAVIMACLAPFVQATARFVNQHNLVGAWPGDGGGANVNINIVQADASNYSVTGHSVFQTTLNFPSSLFNRSSSIPSSSISSPFSFTNGNLTYFAGPGTHCIIASTLFSNQRAQESIDTIIRAPTSSAPPVVIAGSPPITVTPNQSGYCSIPTSIATPNPVCTTFNAPTRTTVFRPVVQVGISCTAVPNVTPSGERARSMTSFQKNLNRSLGLYNYMVKSTRAPAKSKTHKSKNRDKISVNHKSSLQVHPAKKGNQAKAPSSLLKITKELLLRELNKENQGAKIKGHTILKAESLTKKQQNVLVTHKNMLKQAVEKLRKRKQDHIWKKGQGFVKKNKSA